MPLHGLGQGLLAPYLLHPGGRICQVIINKRSFFKSREIVHYYLPPHGPTPFSYAELVQVLNLELATLAC